MKNILLSVIMFVLAMLPNAHAEQKKQLGNWDVHYIAFPAPVLTPEIAKAYDIVRSKYNGVVNISVLDRQTGEAQKVQISGTVKDLQGRQLPLEFNEVIEGDAVYYLATMTFRDEQPFRFTITINQQNVTHQLQFSQTFYAD